jgi:hypothetical protein
VLTGWESVPAAFVATAWHHRADWGGVLDDVRLRTLALLAAGVVPGQRVRASDVPSQLAVMAAGAVAVVDRSPADEVTLDLEAGRRLEAARPDAFEQAWQAIDPGWPAVVAGATFTHANVVAAVRSLALATGAGPGRSVEVRLPGPVPGADLLAALTGATEGPGDIRIDAVHALVVDGHAGVVSIDGVPLPGVAISGDRIRSDAVAPERLVDGWLVAA